MFELILAVSAWRKGWGAWVLLPLAVGFGIAFAAHSLPQALMGDAVIYISLITMLVKGRNQQPASAAAAARQFPEVKQRPAA